MCVCVCVCVCVYVVMVCIRGCLCCHVKCIGTCMFKRVLVFCHMTYIVFCSLLHDIHGDRHMTCMG